MHDSNPKIQIEHLVKIYGDDPRNVLRLFREGHTREAIREKTGHVVGVADVSLTVGRGELFVIMGLSGSGKSTLVRCINRLIPPTSGHIYIDGEDIAHVGDRRLREIRLTQISMVFQGFGLFPHRTVAENVEYGLKLRGMEKAKRRQKALETLETVGLREWGNYRPASLSGGMQQRVGLARALATDAEILLMDEPFGALDPLIRREMQDELLQIQKRLHRTIVFISHDIREAVKLGDRIAVMRDGAIVQVGTPEDLIAAPADDYIRAFTRDIDRAKVMAVRSLIRPVETRQFPPDSSQMSGNSDNRWIYYLDSRGQLLGRIERDELEKVGDRGEFNFSTEYPQVDASTLLIDVFPLFKLGVPVGVRDRDGRFLGIVEASDILATLGDIQWGQKPGF
ncbi:MAG: quaternary amine ABC transporter ATP-binding protein [Limnospira sp.]